MGCASVGMGAILYRASAADTRTHWRPSIHMPRWASRILLEVTEVRVERVQDISEEDARVEGADCVALRCENVPTYRAGFSALWDSINAKRGLGWDANPWVWAVGLRS